ncbi:hypothetical protein HPB51_018906 [Rhipicephalus microplus]|uniref:Uncharacterized protein n=1 Tax=Rhipicephalus microplus TaxID=6941 RepID=A0A9J6D618_RHIMP|nr:hypothetical protein HPB51_018906 [Rhipicephalus microplus]
MTGPPRATTHSTMSPEERRLVKMFAKDMQRDRREQTLRFTIGVLAMCILLLLLGALLIRWATRGPRVVPGNGTKEATAKTPATATVSPSADVPSTTSTMDTPGEPTESFTTETAMTTEEISTTPDPTKPYVPKPGNEHYSGDLVGDVRPLQYDVTFALNGAGLQDAALSVTGRSVALLEVHNATSKVILKAGSTTIKGVKMTLLEVPAAPEEGVKVLGISTLSVNDPFFIVELEEQLEVGKSYKLVVEYDYDTAVNDGPISVSAALAKMQLKEGKAHAAYPCFEKAGWNVPVVLTLETPEKHFAVANTPMDGQPTARAEAASRWVRALGEFGGAYNVDS